MPVTCQETFPPGLPPEIRKRSELIARILVQRLDPFAGSIETSRNAFTGAVKHLSSVDAKIAVSELLADFPVALCMIGESPVECGGK
jgi:hypothetical protein